MKKKNKVIVALARGVPMSPKMSTLRLKIMDYNKRIDDRCAASKIVGDDDPDVLKVIALRLELANLAGKEILGNNPK